MIVIADPDAGCRSRLAGALESQGGLGFVENAQELTQLLSARDDDIDVVVLGPGMTLPVALEAATRLKGDASPTGVVALTPKLTPSILRDAMKAGVRDVLPADFDPAELQTTVDDAVTFAQRVRGRESGEAMADVATKGTVVTIFSSKGGCGKSVVACNLAILLSKVSGEDVALVDLDLESGDLAIMLQVLPALSVYDAAEKSESLDTEALAGYLTRHDSGVDLLAAPPEPSLAGAVSGAAVRSILDILRQSHRYVVIDGPASFTDQLLAGLDASDELVLVTTLDVPSVKNLKLAMQTLEQLGWGRERLRLVLNRADSEVGLRVKDVERNLGTTIDVNVPSSRDVPLSVNEGEPVAHRRSRSPVVAALSELAQDLHGPGTDGTAPRTNGDGQTSSVIGRIFRKATA